MADFINANNQVAIPVELNYALPTSLPMATSREVRVPPINGNSFPITTSTQILQFDIPCGGSGDYLDPTTSYIRFKTTCIHGGTVVTNFSRLIDW